VNNSLFSRDKTRLIKKHSIFARAHEWGLLATFTHLIHRSPHSFWGQLRAAHSSAWGKKLEYAEKNLL
jgi:hypothetical protein